MNKPLISFIIPAYNSENTIINTIKSIRKNTNKNELFEILVV